MCFYLYNSVYIVDCFGIVLMRGQIFDWKLQEIIGFDHAGNTVYKGIDRYREYSAIRIVNFDKSDPSLIN